jgi:hypothetical protein
MPFSPSIPATPLSPVTLVIQIRFAPRLDLSALRTEKDRFSNKKQM